MLKQCCVAAVQLLQRGAGGLDLAHDVFVHRDPGDWGLRFEWRRQVVGKSGKACAQYLLIVDALFEVREGVAGDCLHSPFQFAGHGPHRLEVLRGFRLPILIAGGGHASLSSRMPLASQSSEALPGSRVIVHHGRRDLARAEFVLTAVYGLLQAVYQALTHFGRAEGGAGQ